MFPRMLGIESKLTKGVNHTCYNSERREYRNSSNSMWFSTFRTTWQLQSRDILLLSNPFA